MRATWNHVLRVGTIILICLGFLRTQQQQEKNWFNEGVHDVQIKRRCYDILMLFKWLNNILRIDFYKRREDEMQTILSHEIGLIEWLCGDKFFCIFFFPIQITHLYLVHINLYVYLNDAASFLFFFFNLQSMKFCKQQRCRLLVVQNYKCRRMQNKWLQSDKCEIKAEFCFFYFFSISCAYAILQESW